jgi:hypothetical protein
MREWTAPPLARPAAPSKAVRNTKAARNASFSRMRASPEVLDRVLAGCLMLSYPSTYSSFGILAIPLRKNTFEPRASASGKCQ